MDKESFFIKPTSQQIYILNKCISSYIDDYLQRNLTNYLPKLEGSIISFLGKNKKKNIIVTSTDIYKSLNISKVTVSQALNSLVSKGYVTFMIDGNDRRKKIVSLTNSGQKVIKELDEVFSTLEQKIDQLLDETEKEKMSEILFKILSYIKEVKK